MCHGGEQQKGERKRQAGRQADRDRKIGRRQTDREKMRKQLYKGCRIEDKSTWLVVHFQARAWHMQGPRFNINHQNQTKTINN